jgi:hypothetical protein
MIKVDLVTGVCTPQPSSLLSHRGRLIGCSAASLSDGRIVCVGTIAFSQSLDGTAQALEPPEQGTSASEASKASWQWRYLPGMSAEHYYGSACVLSDGWLAVFGG